MLNITNELPSFYDESIITKVLFGVYQSFLDAEYIKSEDLKKQFQLNTATWGLAFYESMLLLTTDTSIDYDLRRSAIWQKLQTPSTITLSGLENLCTTYFNSAVNVTENYSDYSITISIIDTFGIPSNLEYIRNNLRKVIPAHLNFDFIYRYFTWGEASSKTWGDAGATTWQGIAENNW